MKTSVSSSGSKVSIQKRLVARFHIRYSMQEDEGKVNGIRPISLSYNWSSAETSRLIDKIMIYPTMLQPWIALLNQPVVREEIDGGAPGGSINDTTWSGVFSANFNDFTG